MHAEIAKCDVVNFIHELAIHCELSKHLAQIALAPNYSFLTKCFGKAKERAAEDERELWGAHYSAIIVELEIALAEVVKRNTVAIL